MNKNLLLLFLITHLLSSTICLAQNAYQFIEPNISFSYDSTKLKISNRYSNTFYETESYDFNPTADTINKININVKANHPYEIPTSISEQKSFMQIGINELDKINDSIVSVIYYDKEVRQIGEFSCVGFILLDKKINKTLSTIICNHVTASDRTEIKFTSQNQLSITDDYTILEDFLKGFTSYSKEEIFKEDSLIKAMYTINVVQNSETKEKTGSNRFSYFATVKTKEPLQHAVKEVRLQTGYSKRIFSSKENGEVNITCSDKENGLIERKGEFIILNSFGKKVKIPFTFMYQNK